MRPHACEVRKGMPDLPPANGAATPPRSSGRRWLTTAVVVLVVLAVVLAGAAGYWYGRTTSSTTQGPAAPSLGPSLTVHAGGRTTNGLVTNVSGAKVEVFSVMPLSLKTSEVGLNLRSLSIESNPYYVKLGSGTTNETGSAVILFSSVFKSVEAGWEAMAGPPTTNVSVQLEATYVTSVGTNASLFHYYDQIDYDPYLPVTNLTASFDFDLATPYATGSLNAALSSSSSASAGACGTNLTTSWSTVAFSVTTGFLPLAGLVDNLSLPTSEIVSMGDGWILSPTIEIGFGGVQDAFPGIVEASVDPAWTGVIPNFGQEGSSNGAITNETHFAQVPTIDLTGATYLVVGQVEEVHWGGAGTCGAFALNVTFVTSSVPLVMTGLPQCSGFGCLEILYAESGSNNTGQELEALPGQSLLNSTSLVSASNIEFANLIESDPGHASALAAEGSALGTSLVFSLSLGDAILLADAEEYDCSLFCLANPSQAYATILLAQFGPAVSELPSDGIYGFAAQFNASSSGSVQLVGYGNQFVNITSAALLLYGGSNQTYLNIGGVLYGTTMPDIGPIVCELGTTPGHGC